MQRCTDKHTSSLHGTHLSCLRGTDVAYITDWHFIPRVTSILINSKLRVFIFPCWRSLGVTSLINAKFIYGLFNDVTSIIDNTSRPIGWMESDKLQRVSKRAGRVVIRCYSGSFFPTPFQNKFQSERRCRDRYILIENFSCVSQKTFRFVLMGHGLSIFNPEDGISKFLRNVSSLPKYTTLQSINP